MKEQKKVLGWKPKINLKEDLKKTCLVISNRDKINFEIK